MNEPKFKVGDIVVYLGTKDGVVDDLWNEYFGQYDIVAGDRATIKSCYPTDNNRYEYFVYDEKRPTHNGRLFDCDLDFPNIVIDDWESELIKQEEK